MFGFLQNRPYPIGVDLGDDCVKLAQLADNKNRTSLVAARQVHRPDDVKSDSVQWQRWAIDMLRDATANGQFKGRDVVSAIPSSRVFIDHVKTSKSSDVKIEDFIFSRIKQKLPFEPVRESVMMKYIATGSDSFLVMATERKIIERHLAIYEKAGLTLKSIGVWPMALANCYARFFGRRKSDVNSIVMLLDIQPDCTNLVISRHKDPLFAGSVPIGAGQLEDENALGRLVFEVTGCRRNFASMHKESPIERLIFLSGLAVDAETYREIAKQLQIQAQMGDCLAAVECADHENCGVDRRNGKVSWAAAFGLSVS
jgi:Tfp pilus assembly PilM family ATPase